MHNGDSLQALGTFPHPDLDQFAKASQAVAYFRAMKYLKRHYPEVTKGIRFKKGMLLNVAFMIHFLRLRLFLNKELSL